MLPDGISSYLAEPAVANAPRRVARDWWLVGLVSAIAVAEFTFRSDAEWEALSLGWHIAGLVAFFAVVPYCLLARRRQPLRALALGFGVALALGFVSWLAAGESASLMATASMLIVEYALFRWGSGRDGAIGVGVLLAAFVVGNITGAASVSDVIGGAIVLFIPAEIGLVVRYRRSARERAILTAQSREREALARELHDTVAHHVSAIAVQAQAGRVVAATDPQRAIEVLAVIEEAAARTLDEMRAIVGALRSTPDTAPQRGVADLSELAGSALPLQLHVRVDPALGQLEPAIDAAVFRVAQESITNAVRHAQGATAVHVDVAPVGSGVRVEISDDGVAPTAGRGDGYGLLGMAERAQLLGGTFEAGPGHTRGWRVCADFPRHGGREDRQ